MSVRGEGSMGDDGDDDDAASARLCWSSPLHSRRGGVLRCASTQAGDAWGQAARQRQRQRPVRHSFRPGVVVPSEDQNERRVQHLVRLFTTLTLHPKSHTERCLLQRRPQQSLAKLR